MKRFMNMLRRAARDNRGSGLVMVLVCMICVALLGATMLQMAYIGLRIKVTERTATKDFYDAAAAMDEIRAGLQEVVSDCVGVSYKNILLSYNQNFDEMIATFQQDFADNLVIWELKDENDLAAPGQKLLLSGDITGPTGMLINSTGKYSIDVLESFIEERKAPATVATIVTETNKADWVFDAATKELVFQNVHVRYTDSSNYTTDVKADIVLTLPDFTYIMSEFSITGLPEFALIAKTELTKSTNTLTSVEGSAYAGKVTVNTGSVKLSKGTVVCAENILVTDSTAKSEKRIEVSEDASLWANGIDVEGARIQLQGTTYLADDLDLKSANSQALLEGRYFGYGYSAVNPSASSAILINGKNTVLDMSKLQRLMLSGYSFISDSYSTPHDSEEGFLMGESISTRRNQQIYLMPASYLKYYDENDIKDDPSDDKLIASNPVIINQNETGYEEDLVNPSIENIDTRKVIPTSEGEDYLTKHGGTLKKLHVNIPGFNQQAVYYFVTFDTPGDANNFFKNYFNNPDHYPEIETYLNGYTKLSHSLGIVDTAGYTLKVNEDGQKYTLGNTVSAGRLETSSKQMEDTFKRLKQRLFDQGEAKDTDTNPYMHFVEEERIATIAASPMEFKNADVVEGIVVKGDYTWKGDYPDLRVILASGDVTVEKDFTGLIISGGTITISTGCNAITANGEEVTAALTAKNNAGDMLSTFLKDGVIEDYASGSDEEDTGWNYNKLVTYRNWDKNSDN